MKTTEASIQATLKQALETLGYIVLEVAKARSAKAAGLWTGTTPGTPDVFVSHPEWPQGEWLGLELKTATGRLRPAQKALNEKGRTVVVRSVWEGLQAVGMRESDFQMTRRAQAGDRHEKLLNMAWGFRDKTAPRVEVTVTEGVGK